MIETEFSRSPIDLGALTYQIGDIGRLTTLSVIPVVAGDSFEQHLLGSFKMSPMRRNLTLDAKVDIMTFYVPHRHVYGDEWIQFMRTGVSDPSNPNTLKKTTTIRTEAAPTLAISAFDPNKAATIELPAWTVDPYFQIWNNYFRIPSMPEKTQFANGEERGLRCANIKTIWSADLPFDPQHTNIDLVAGNTAVNAFDIAERMADIHTNQEREYFMNRYRDIMDSFGGYANADVDNRPTLLNRTSLYTSGYDVDGTTSDTLGQYQGRVTMPYSHKVPRFFCPEHGSIWTMMVPRFDPVVFFEQNWLLSQEQPSYEVFACDPTVVGNQRPFETPFQNFFSQYITSQAEVRIPHSQWYREQANYVHPSYGELQGYPFYDFRGGIIDSDKRRYVIPEKYDEVFQTLQLRHWQTQARNNVTVLRNIPTARQAMMLSDN